MTTYSVDDCLTIDIGGTSIKVGKATKLSDQIELGQIRTVTHTCGTAAELVAAVSGVIKEEVRGTEYLRVAISTTGSVRKNGVVASGPFEGYVEFSWAAALSEQVSADVSVSVINDGQAAAFGTYTKGFSSQADPLALFTVGTGIGGGIVCNGHVVRGANGFAGLFGHVKIRDGGDDVCICTRVGCVENSGSGRGIAAEFLGRPVSFGEVNAAIQEARRMLVAGEESAYELFRSAGSALGQAIGDIANIFDPELIVVSGGTVRAADDGRGTNVFFEAAKETALSLCTKRIAAAVNIIRSDLENPNLFGAAAYAFSGDGSSNAS